MRENSYQSILIRKIHRLYPTCVVLKNDSEYLQGVPDLIILFNDMWAMLEVKASEHSPCQPNQSFYVRQFNEMSFAAFIYPENEEDVLYELEQTFRPRRSTRVSKRK